MTIRVPPDPTTPPTIHAPFPLTLIPPLPPARGFESSASSELRPRYEDIAQDGRVQLTSLMPGLGAVWRALSDTGRFAAMRDSGALPVLSRLVLTGEAGPFSVQAALTASGTWRLARERDGDRIFVDMWLDVHAPISRSFGPPPAPDAPRVLVGRVYAEHVVTRPFGPLDDRKVTRLAVPGLPAVPEDLHPFETAAALVGGHALDPAGEHAFGLMHTDSNQHVNSLVYARVFEEAIVRRLADQPNGGASWLSRRLELRYRKPFFAGERAAIALRVVDIARAPSPDTRSPPPRGIFAIGAFTPSGAAPDTKPSCTVAMQLD